MLLVLLKHFFNIIAVSRAVVLSALTKVVVLYTKHTVWGQIGRHQYQLHLCNWADFREVL